MDNSWLAPKQSTLLTRHSAKVKIAIENMRV